MRACFAIVHGGHAHAHAHEMVCFELLFRIWQQPENAALARRAAIELTKPHVSCCDGTIKIKAPVYSRHKIHVVEMHYKTRRHRVQTAVLLFQRFRLSFFFAFLATQDHGQTVLLVLRGMKTARMFR